MLHCGPEKSAAIILVNVARQKYLRLKAGWIIASFALRF